MACFYTDRDRIWYRFLNIDGIGLVSQWKLLEVYGDPEALFKAGPGTLKEMLAGSLKDRQIRALSFPMSDDKAGRDLKELSESMTRFIHWESEDYPEKLRHIFRPPLGLYVRGRLPDPDFPALAIVGSRKASNYGRTIARRFAKELAGHGILTISGLAAGIDTECHRGALEAGAYTAAVLGGGIDTIYPRSNFNLYYDMYQRGGVISEYNAGINNYSGLFPMRNRIISGLSDGVFVVEAGEKSGSLITADLCMEQGKDVFALPGRITDVMSRGCNKLIADGAVPVLDVEDILEVLSQRGCLKEYHPAGSPGAAGRQSFALTKEERKVLSLIDEINAVSFQDLLYLSDLSKTELERILLTLEMNYQIVQPVQGLFQKKTR